MGRVALTLVTGPANAEKAGVVLGAYRAAIDREPLLVVPTAADVDHYRRELADSGLVHGGQVVGFRRLMREIALRAGVAAPPLSPAQRERVVAAAVADVELLALARSARTPGFARVAGRFVSELEEARIDPPRLTRALRDWAGADERRRRYVDEISAIYLAYRRRLEGLGRVDRELHARAALDAIRLEPARWNGTPVFFYGFDDLSPVQMDAVETLGRVVGADVMVSLPYEPGRAAFAGRATTVQELEPLAGERVVRLEARPEHYAEGSRAVLHHLERNLFEGGAERLGAGGTVVMLEGGGERAELELVAAEITRLMAGGTAAEDIAVVLRSPEAAAELVEDVFGAAAIPLAFERRIPFGHTSLGRGLMGLARCALLDAPPAELLAWLRTPGLLRRPELADALEDVVRRRGLATAQAARTAWEEMGFFQLDALDRLRSAYARSPAALLEALGREAASLFAAPFRRQAAVLDSAATADARALAEARRALAELAELLATDRSLAPPAGDLIASVAGLEVAVGERPGPGRVSVTDPLAIRARRVRALFACRMQEGTFPPGPVASRHAAAPFFSEEERREIAVATGLPLPRVRDALGAERYLFYATVSRPTDRLCLSWHTADDDGGSAVPSFFVADVADLLAEDVFEHRRRRELGEVRWPDHDAPSPRLAARSVAAAGPRAEPEVIAPLRHPAVLGRLAERPAWSASSLEAWAGCPVQWFVERFLRARPLGPDAESIVRGSLAHRVLEEVFAELSEPLRPDTLPAARRALAEALARNEAEHPISPNAQRMRAAMRRLEAHLERYIEHAALSRSSLRPWAFEVAFGGDEDEHGALELGGGELRLAGRIDRVDVGPDGRTAVIVDYKSGATVKAAAKWVDERGFQAVLYMLAAKQVLKLDPVGTLYQPLGGADLRAAGALLADADPDFDVANGTRMDAEALQALVDDVVAAALTALREIRAGALEPRPDTCGYRGSGCRHPGFCRREAM